MGIDLQDYYISVEWDIMRVPAVRNEKFYSCCEEPYPDIIFNITLRRKTLFYTVNLIIPCVGISFLSVLVFYLPSDSGEKVSGSNPSSASHFSKCRNSKRQASKWRNSAWQKTRGGIGHWVQTTKTPSDNWHCQLFWLICPFAHCFFETTQIICFTPLIWPISTFLP